MRKENREKIGMVCLFVFLTQYFHSKFISFIIHYVTNKRFLITAAYPFSFFRFVFTDKLLTALEKEILDLNNELSALKLTSVKLDGTGIRLKMIYE